MKEIVFAGGCFWGVQAYFQRVNGVINSEVGYANSVIVNPSYEQVCTGNTNAVEVTKIEYDEQVINLSTLIELLFIIIDPTSLNKQGNDKGTQYRTGIYFVDKDDEVVAKKYIASRVPDFSSPILVEVTKLRNYFKAENYHQDYLDKNPNGYCHVNLSSVPLMLRKNSFNNK